MKTISFLASVFLLVTLFSCEDVIEVNRPAQYSQIAVEGVIVNKAGESYVLLSNTASYFSDDASTPVTDALVAVKDSDDKTVYFEEAEMGRYVAPADFIGIPGKTYFLTATAGERVLTAESRMPDSVQITNGRLELVPDDDPYRQKGYYLYGTLNDNPGSDYFKSTPYINGVRQQKTASDLQVFDDRFFNGLGEVEGTFAHWGKDHDADVRLQKGDVVTIRLYTLDRTAYNYFKALKDTPSRGSMYGKNSANLPSNIIGGVGLFHASAWTASEGAVVER